MEASLKTWRNEATLAGKLLAIVTLPWRAYRWMMHTRPIRFTRFGAFYVLFCIGVGAAAINTGNNLLYLILGVLLGFIILSGVLSDSCLWGLDSDWISLGNGYAGESTLFDCRLKKGWFPAVAVSITPRWQGLPAQTQTAFWVPGRGRENLRYSVTPSRRGWLRLENVRYATRFPFGLFEKTHEERRDEGWLVYPRIRPIRIERLRFWTEDRNDRLSGRQGDGAVPYLLRDFRAGDSARQISWKASAKRDRWIVKEMEDEQDQGEWLAITHWPADDTEDFISFVASLLFHFHEAGRAVGLLTPDASFAPERTRQQLYHALRYLALLDLGTAPKVSNRRLPPRAMEAVSLWQKERHAA